MALLVDMFGLVRNGHHRTEELHPFYGLLKVYLGQDHAWACKGRTDPFKLNYSKHDVIGSYRATREHLGPWHMYTAIHGWESAFVL